MKTAKEWWSDFKMDGITSARFDLTFDSMVKQIQLDAMKEGMRKAAKILDPMDGEPISSMEKAIKSAYNVILAAAEQLTEKDL